MVKKKIETQCESCGGTGIYVGICEKDGAGVVCNNCNGTGKRILEYIPFTERKIRKDIKRVFPETFGFCIGVEDHTMQDGNILHFSQFGCTYEEWLNGKTPLVIKELICPHLQNQSWKWIKCNDCELGRQIIYCPHYDKKEECWKGHDKEVMLNV